MENKEKELMEDSCKKKLCAALGYFDGVHIGHRALLKKATLLAAELDAVPAVWTFKQNYKGTFIDTEEEKRSAFAECGIEKVIFEDFFMLKDMSPEDFVKEILISKLNCAAVICGFDFRFGKNASGDVSLLKNILEKEGVSLHVIDAVKKEENTVSSSLIKEYISEGRIEEANAMLGRAFSLSSPVLHGKALGRSLGFPTLNQRVIPGRICPKYGVYFSDVRMGNESFFGVTNIGSRPSIDDGDTVNAETYVFGLNRDVYGETVKVELRTMSREEKRFSSKEELSKAISLDVENAMRYFNIDKNGVPYEQKERDN